jgi:hypothetical protein
MFEFPIDLEQFIRIIGRALSPILGEQIPQWLLSVIAFVLLVTIVLFVVWILMVLISRIKTLWVNEFWPVFYNREEKRRSNDRMRFARHIEREIWALNDKEEWRDDRYAELEAEVEAEGRTVS